jgi:hypothetical protein
VARLPVLVISNAGSLGVNARVVEHQLENRSSLNVKNVSVFHNTRKNDGHLALNNFPDDLVRYSAIVGDETAHWELNARWHVGQGLNFLCSGDLFRREHRPLTFACADVGMVLTGLPQPIGGLPK